MSRIDELKKQNPGLGFNIITALTDVLPKTKYVELMLNIVKNDKTNESAGLELKQILVDEFGFNRTILDTKSYFEILCYYRFFSDYIYRSRFDNFKKFIDYNERNLIVKNDLTTYTSFDDIEKQISICDLKSIDEELEKQVIKVHETDEWLILKPLSWSASKKYGSATKWCTAMEYESDHFYRYSKDGVLIYSINKITGDKFAVHKGIKSLNREISFWDIKDNRIDSIELDIPDDIFLLIKNVIKNSDIPNWNLLSKESQIKIENSDFNFNSKKMYDIAAPRNVYDIAAPGYDRPEYADYDILEEDEEIPSDNDVKFKLRTASNTLVLEIVEGSIDDELNKELNDVLNQFNFRENSAAVRHELAVTLFEKFGFTAIEIGE